MATKKKAKSKKKVSKKKVLKKKKATKKSAKKAAPKNRIKKKVAAKKKSAPKKKNLPKKVKKEKSLVSKAKASVARVIKKAQKTVGQTVEKVKNAIPTTTHEEHSLVGSMAPKLKLQNQNGQEVDLSDVVESNPKVVLYFYPKDDTPGCTTEACNFRDSLNRIQKNSALVLGVSPDAPDSHKKFADKFNLNFDLLSDVNQELCEAFKVWKEKSFMGRNYMGVDRSTFLFHNGRVVKAWQPVKVEGHVDQVLSTIEALG